MRIKTTLLAACAAALIAPAASQAATLGMEGHTLVYRGEGSEGISLLLTSYAWGTIGMIAGIAAWVAFAGAAVVAVLVIAGLVHLRRSRA